RLRLVGAGDQPAGPHEVLGHARRDALVGAARLRYARAAEAVERGHALEVAVDAAGRRVAGVDRAGVAVAAADGRAADAASLSAALVLAARVAVVARGAVLGGRVGAQAGGRVTHAGVVALVRRAAGDGRAALALPGLAGVALRAQVAVVARGAVRLEHVRGAVVGDAVAALGDVAVAGGRTADCRALHIGGTRGLRARAELGHVAGARGRAALGGRRLEGVGGAGGAGAGAELRLIAGARRGTALDGRCLEAVGRAVVGDAVAALGHVAAARGGAADRRALRVGRTEAARPGAELGGVAGSGRGTAFGRRRLEGVGGASGARAGAELGDVAR